MDFANEIGNVVSYLEHVESVFYRTLRNSKIQRLEPVTNRVIVYGGKIFLYLSRRLIIPKLRVYKNRIEHKIWFLPFKVTIL